MTTIYQGYHVTYTLTRLPCFYMQIEKPTMLLCDVSNPVKIQSSTGGIGRIVFTPCLNYHGKFAIVLP